MFKRHRQRLYRRRAIDATQRRDLPIEWLEQRVLLTGVPEIFVTSLSGNTVSAYTTAGATVSAPLISGIGGRTIAVSGADLLVSNGGSIQEYTTDGGTVNTSLVSGISYLSALVISGSDIFACLGTGAIVEAPLSGGTGAGTLVSGVAGYGIAISGSDMFVTNYSAGTIGEYTTAGATVNASLVSGLSSPYGIAISGSDIFVTNLASGKIGEYTTNGATVNASLVTGLNEPTGIAISGTDMFVANDGAGTIGEYTTTGTTENASLISGLNSPYGLAISTVLTIPTITWANPANIASTTPLSSTQLDATANVAGTFAYTPAAGSYLSEGNDQQLSVLFTPTDTSDYASIGATVSVNVTGPEGIFITNSTNGTIGEYDSSGTAVNASLVSGLSSPNGIVVSGSDLFVVNTTAGTIGEYTTSGAMVNAALVSGLLGPQGLAISGSDLFVANSTGGTIGEYTTSGATVNAALVSGLGDPSGVVVDGSDLFVGIQYGNTNSEGGAVGEYTTSGATVNASFVYGFGNYYKPYGMLAVGSNLFIADDNGGGAISEFTTSGETVNAFLINELETPRGVAMDGSNLLITNQTNGTVSEYTTSGTLVNSALIFGLSGPYGIAVANITAPEPNKLAFAQEPQSATTTGTLGPITVDVEDSNGNLLTSDNSNVTLAIASGTSGAALSGTTTVAAMNGVATFTGVSITTAGDNYTLTATDGSDTAATSTSFAITASVTGGSSPQLAFAQQPAGTTTGATLAPIIVDINNSSGNLLTNDNSNVTLAIASGPSGATLGGTTTVAAVNGVAMFSDLSLAIAGDNYTLTATDGSDLSATSNNFTITSSGPSGGGGTAHAIFAHQPGSVAAGAKISPLLIDLDNADGSLAITAHTKVILTIANGPSGGTLFGSIIATVRDGVAAFKNLSLRKAGSYTLEASASGFASADSSTITITGGAVKKAIFSSEPANVAAGTPFNVAVELTDAFGNEAGGGDTVTLALQAHPKGSTLAGDLTATVSSGVADFDDLTLVTAGNYSLKTAAGKAKATSSKFIVS